jgi:hypothetical protein
MVKVEDDAPTASENVSDAVLPALSWTVAINELVPNADAAPLNKPVAGFRLMPAGSAPPGIDQVYGGMPPEAERVVE